VCVLLRIARKFRRCAPRCRQEAHRAIWTRILRVHRCEQLIHLTARAIFRFAQLAVMLVAEKPVTEKWIGHIGLQNDVEEACLTKIQEATSALTRNCRRPFESRYIFVRRGPRYEWFATFFFQLGSQYAFLPPRSQQRRVRASVYCRKRSRHI